MTTNWQNIKKTVQDELSGAAATTRKYFKIGKSKLDIMDTNKSLHHTYQELGIEVDKLINEGTKKDIRQNPKVINLIAKIKVLRQDISDDKLEIKVTRKGHISKAKTDKGSVARTKKKPRQQK